MKMRFYTVGLLALVCLAIGRKVEAQTFTLSNYTPVIAIADPWQDTESYVYVANTSNSAKEVKVERFINTLAAGHIEFFCFGAGSTGLCYPPGTDASNGQDTIFANSVDQSFKATIRPLGNYGYTSLHFRFSDSNNASDSVGVDLAFDFTTSIAENTGSFGFTKPLQNPADAFTAFNYNLPQADKNDRLVVYNMLGATLRTVDVPGKSGVLVLPTADLVAGVYLVSYVRNGKNMDSCRLVVSHR